MQAVLKVHADQEQTPVFQLKQITKEYNSGKTNAFLALKGVDITVYQGEFIAIMGPSGSGKSTIMNIIGALDVPTTGEYLIEGKNIGLYSNSQLAEFRNQKIGFVFQQFNLLPKLDVRNNILLPSIYGPIEDKEQRVIDVLKEVGLESKIHNKPNQLSGGEMQRVAIARALLMSPKIILADEPTGNLDTKTSYEVMSIFQKLNDEGNTIILITHEPDIAKYASRVINIKDGEVDTQ